MTLNRSIELAKLGQHLVVAFLQEMKKGYIFNLFRKIKVVFSVNRRLRSDVGQSSFADLTDVSLVSEDAFWRLD